jgi:hypothetical protein
MGDVAVGQKTAESPAPSISNRDIRRHPAMIRVQHQPEFRYASPAAVWPDLTVDAYIRGGEAGIAQSKVGGGCTDWAGGRLPRWLSERDDRRVPCGRNHESGSSGWTAALLAGMKSARPNIISARSTCRPGTPPYALPCTMR